MSGFVRADLVNAASDSAARLRAWLLHGPASMRTGVQTGGVAGTIAADGSPRYVYAEITGYYLSWLADLSATESAALAIEPAKRAIAWAARAFASSEVPPTRIYLDATEAEPDWRNDAVFFFDLAMLLRGLDAASEAGIADVPAELRAALHMQLLRFVDNDTLCCVLPLRTDVMLPQRWSTCGGPFLVNASSRVAYGARQAALPAALARACVRENERWAQGAGDIELGMLHPTLYFAEGLLLAHADRTSSIARLLRRCLDLAQIDGALPETDGTRPENADDSTNVKLRNDIIAQALRIGLLLRDAGEPHAPTQSEQDRLAQALVARVDAAGFLAFDIDSAAQANVWCSIFAEQALRWYADAGVPGTPRPSAAALV
jgi:hypothetical protein